MFWGTPFDNSDEYSYLWNYALHILTENVTNAFWYVLITIPMTDWRRFEKLDTGKLISYSQNTDNESDTKDGAFLALCFRFRADLLKKCEFLCKRKGYDIDVAVELVKNTFKKYGKSRKFNASLGNHESIDDCFKFYLYKIAQHELIDYYKREQKRLNGQLYTGDETIITNLANVNPETLDAESQIIHETLLELPYSHQVIYMTYKAHEKEGVNLPRSLQKQLREHLGGISQATVRAYKKEAVDKIEKAKAVIEKMNKIKASNE